MQENTKDSGNSAKIKCFQDLVVWQEGHKLVLALYNLSANFPASENIGLKSQLRRAAVSVTSCIAEGFSRNTYKDKYNFYRMAQGSLTEIQNQLIIAHDLGYLEKIAFDNIYNQTVFTHKLLTGLCKSTRNRFDS
jgi:four helix bundle protein